MLKIPKQQQQQATTTDEQVELLNVFREKKPWLNVGDGHIRSPSLESVAVSEFPDEFWTRHFVDFCSDQTLLRYLRANGSNVDLANTALVSTLQWRRAYQPHLIAAEEVADIAKSGKTYVNGYTKHSQPVLYFRAHLDPLKPSERDYARDVRFLIYNIEAAIALMPDGADGKLCLIFDFSQYSRNSAVPMNVSRYFLHLFSQHYPERLAQMFACDAPWYFTAFYRMISPFIHPVTKAKIKFVDTKTQASLDSSDGVWANMLHYIDSDILEAEFGGSSQWTYDHDTYWTALSQELCKST